MAQWSRIAPSLTAKCGSLRCGTALLILMSELIRVRGRPRVAEVMNIARYGRRISYARELVGRDGSHYRTVRRTLLSLDYQSKEDSRLTNTGLFGAVRSELFLHCNRSPLSTRHDRRDEKEAMSSTARVDPVACPLGRVLQRLLFALEVIERIEAVSAVGALTVDEFEQQVG